MALVRDVMSKPVITVKPGSTVAEAAKLMRDSKIGSLIVVEAKDRPIGIVTETDIIYKIVAEKKPLDTEVGEIMTRDIKTIREDETIEQAARVMAAHVVRRLPVMKSKRLVGIIALKDVVKAKKVDRESEYYPYFT